MFFVVKKHNAPQKSGSKTPKKGVFFAKKRPFFDDFRPVFGRFSGIFGALFALLLTLPATIFASTPTSEQPLFCPQKTAPLAPAQQPSLRTTQPTPALKLPPAKLSEHKQVAQSIPDAVTTASAVAHTTPPAATPPAVVASASTCAAGVKASEMAAKSGEEQYVTKPFSKFCNVNKTAAVSAEFAAAAKAAGAERAAVLFVVDGKCRAGRVFNFSQLSDEELVKKSFSLGRSSVALLSLAVLGARDDATVNPDADVSRYFSQFRTSSGGIKGGNLHTLLSGRAGLGYLVEKIPQHAGVEEFFDTLAQIPFAAPDTVFAQPELSASIAGYALAYAFEPKSKNLKKSFVRACSKFLFKPLKITGVKYRNFDRISFPAQCFVLDIESITKWLECETSPLPPLADSAEIAQRRRCKFDFSKYSEGWTRSESQKVETHFTQSLSAADSNFIAVFNSENESAAVAFFIGGVEPKKAFSLFSNGLLQVDNILLENEK